MASIFANPIGTTEPLPVFQRKGNHPVSRERVATDPALPVGTNNFYTNFLFGKESICSWTNPYQTRYHDGITEPQWHGLGVGHYELERLGYPLGMDPNGTDPIQFYVNPNDAKDVVFGANEFMPGATTFEVSKTNQFSVDVNIYANKAVYGDTKMATFTLVQGMGFFTGRYKNLTPRLSSVVPINFVEVPAPSGITQKWRLTLEDGNKWLVYAKADPGSSTDSIKFSLLTGGRHIASTLPPFSGVIQAAKIPNTVGGVEKFEPIYDQTCGAYPIGATLDGSVTGTTGRYTLAYQYEGSSQLGKMVIWALPHHVSSFDSATASALTGMRLRSTTKGMMTAVVANSLTMVEPNLPTEISWLPGGDTMTPSVAEAVAYAASIELPLQDISAATDLNSMYWAGKVFGKYAQMILVLALSQKNNELAIKKLKELQTAFQRFTSGKNQFPLVYDTKWKGIISDAIFQTGDSGQDYGNSHYNDHHFHYGYFVGAAAAIAYTEKILYGQSPWQTANAPWVNQLVRDVANPSPADKYFPVSRAFDWFHGHSWAKGLFQSGDGKDEESSSEDVMWAYSMRQWAREIGDPAMEARGNIMLAVLRRSLNEYMLLSKGCPNHPERFVMNKVTGILFEGKADHTTYFGNKPEYIQGIHMIPILATTPYIRKASFVQEEWDTYFSNGRFNSVDTSWKGLLLVNYATCDPKGVMDALMGQLDATWLDGGASRTWYLAYVGGLQKLGMAP